jgi:hypothetical protein
LYLSSQLAEINNIAYPVPYVVDFSQDLQQPIPRPFYCTAYNASAYDDGQDWGFFFDHDWSFFSLPEIVSIDSAQLYVDSDWIWGANDGEIE